MLGKSRQLCPVIIGQDHLFCTFIDGFSPEQIAILAFFHQIRIHPVTLDHGGVADPAFHHHAAGVHKPNRDSGDIAINVSQQHLTFDQPSPEMNLVCQSMCSTILCIQQEIGS